MTCCWMMRDNIDQSCPLHPNGQCPDEVVRRTSRGYVLPIHDGGGSGIVIKYCPWCGVLLSKNQGNAACQ